MLLSRAVSKLIHIAFIGQIFSSYISQHFVWNIVFFLLGRIYMLTAFLPVLRSGLLMAILGLALLGMSVNPPFLIGSSILFVSRIAIAVPTLIALIGKLGGSARGAAVSTYTFILFSGASIGPLLALSILKISSHFTTFLALALCLFFGLASSIFICIHMEIRIDFDNSRDIGYWEAVLLGTALSINTLAGGLYAGIAGISSLYQAGLVGLISFFTIAAGCYFGKKYAAEQLGKYATIIFGTLLIVIGVHQLFH